MSQALDSSPDQPAERLYDPRSKDDGAIILKEFGIATGSGSTGGLMWVAVMGNIRLPFLGLSKYSEPVTAEELRIIRLIGELRIAKEFDWRSDHYRKIFFKDHPFVGDTGLAGMYWCEKSNGKWYYRWSQWEHGPRPVNPEPTIENLASQILCNHGVPKAVQEMRDSDARYAGIKLFDVNEAMKAKIPEGASV